MKKTHKLIALLAITALTLFAFVGCGGTDPCEEHKDDDANGVCDVCQEALEPKCTSHKDLNDDGKCDTSGCGENFTDGCDVGVCLDTDGDGKCDNSGCDKTVPIQKATYTVTITTAGGMKMPGIKVWLMDDDGNLSENGTTDENGICTFTNIAKKNYVISLSGIPAGYNKKNGYTFENGKAEITLTSSVLASKPAGFTSYKLGDVMHDFEVTDTTGKKIKLSELLKTKKAVLINFWFSTCGPCVNEFPYMHAAYEEFREDLEIVALNSSDSLNEIKVFQSEMGLTFPCVSDMSVETNFSLPGYPTSVIVDRYGVICLMETGGLTSQRPFNAAFEHFTSDNYEQKIINSFDELTPAEKPIYQMPSSDDIKDAVTDGSFDVDFTIYRKDGKVEEFAWPFVIDKKGDRVCLMSSNYNREGSYAQIFAYVSLKAGEAIAFDYFAQTERDSDYLYVLVDGKDIYTIHGTSNDWERCYPFVATEDGTYEIAFIYLKDNDVSVEGDRIYIDNLEKVDVEDIDKETYIPRYAATKPNENGFGYQQYAEIVFNEKDGYYHVGTKDGPILLANLMGTTRFNAENSIYNMAYDGEISQSGGLSAEEYYEKILPYFSAASNSSLNGYCSVTEELMQLLVIANKAVGNEPNNDKAWLQICSYYDAYGTDGVQLEDPIKGLTTFSAYEAKMGEDNYVYYNRVIMPRGLWYRFTPTVSGVYRITSNSEWEVDGWIFLADKTEYLTYWHCEKGYYTETDVSMVAYFEAGVDYYIDIAFYDVYQVGGFTFDVKFEGETLDYLRLASPGYFTYYENENTGVEDLNEIINVGIKVIFNPETGYYHHDLGKNENGEQIYGSVLYIDFVGGTTIFSGAGGAYSLIDMINRNAFNFTISESDQEILNYMEIYKTVEATDAYLRNLWGDTYEAYAEIYRLEDIYAGIYPGDHEIGDLTDEISAYLDKLYKEGDVEDDRLVGCVMADAELVEILTHLMDKYTFAGVKDSWTKLAYFYEHLGPAEADAE